MSDLVVREQGAVAPVGQVADVMNAVQRAASDPSVDADKMAALWKLAMEMKHETAKDEFFGALARIQAKRPRIHKDGAISIKGSVQSRYAKLENIDSVMRPLMEEEGFALSFDTEQDQGKMVVIGKLTHRMGHSEIKRITLPMDTSGNKNGTQSAGSTFSYGQRYLYKAHFNIVEEGADTDGNPPPEFITEAQVIELEDLLASTRSNVPKFLDWMGVQKLRDIPAPRFQEAKGSLLRKAGGQR